MSSSKTAVDVQITDLLGELEIVDGNFRVVDHGFGRLTTSLAPGIYKARARVGSAQTEALFVVEASSGALAVSLSPPRFASPVPLPGTSSWRERHQQAIARATSVPAVDAGLGNGALVLFSVRDPSDAYFERQPDRPAQRDNYRRSFDGFRLRSASGELLRDFDTTAKRDENLGIAIDRFDVGPGFYILTYEPDGVVPIAMPLWALSGRESRVFINVDVPGDCAAPGRADLPDRAWMMVSAARAFDPSDRSLRLTEVARYALVSSRAALPRVTLEKLLEEGFDDPILGLYAANLHLLERPEHDVLDRIAERVAGMTGEDFPDTIALRMATAELTGAAPGNQKAGPQFPPLLRASWDVLSRHPGLLPAGSLLGGLGSSRVASGPWLAWKWVASSVERGTAAGLTPLERSQPTTLQELRGQLNPGQTLTFDELQTSSDGLRDMTAVQRETKGIPVSTTPAITPSTSGQPAPDGASRKPPTLIIHTVYFDDSDRDDAYRLGIDLYGTLTRPVNDRLAFGAGIPVFCAVRPEAVDLSSAEHVVLLCVLGKTAFGMQLDAVLSHLRDWHGKLGPGHVLPVPIAPNWRNVEDRLLGKLLLTELYGDGDRRRATIDEIVLAVTRLLERDIEKTTLFVSHAKADLGLTKGAAKQIYDYVVADTTGKGFFDKTQLLPGEPLGDRLDEASGRGVFVAVRSDAYSSRNWCQRELLTAKRRGIPTLTVEILRSGEQRSSPYGGNGPTIVWDSKPADVVSRAMVEWLRATHFRQEAERIKEFASLPDDFETLIRPPELLDLAQGPLKSGQAQLVLHPDPELSVIERQILTTAHPRLRLVTPTTTFRRLLSRGDGAPGDAPLEGLQVAMSLSDSPDIDGPEGYTKHHVDDATVYLARSLISAGGSIAYGGDFRHNGFTPLLAELISAYNQTAARPAEFLHSYLGAPLDPSQAPGDLPLSIHHLVRSPDVRVDALMPAPVGDIPPHHRSLYFSDMRRVMAKWTSARILLGGAAVPGLAGRPGYGGRYPGVVEEAWRTLEAGKPLYVAGGFGGAAALVAEILDGKPNPERLKDATWFTQSKEFEAIAQRIDEDENRTLLGLPKKMEDLADAVSALGLPYLKSDEAALAWNGLTEEENRILFWTRDLVTISALVLKGLLAVTQAQTRIRGNLEIELVRGSVTTASNLDAIAIATFEGIPLGGAGAALDELVGGRATLGRREGRQLISVQTGQLDVNWVYLASLGPLESSDKLVPAIEEAARSTAAEARRHGLRRLGIVAFGGAVLSDVAAVAKAMMVGLKDLAGFASLAWYEADLDRFDQLHKALGAEDGVKLTTRLVERSLSPELARDESLILQVNHRAGELAVTILPPAGNGTAGSRRIPLDEAQMARWEEGAGRDKRSTPDLKTVDSRGRELANSLLGDNAAWLLGRLLDAKTVVVHDVSSSRIPFELLASAGSVPLAVRSGFSRRLAVEGIAVERVFARPPKAGRFQVLLVVDPTKNLAGAAEEGKRVRAILEQQSNQIQLMPPLEGSSATLQAVLTALPAADVFHYCGHGFFDGPGEEESGLILAAGERLTLTKLRGTEMPRIAFVNACEAVRVRAESTDAASFAEFFLRSGVEAYLGAFWRVGDAAAQLFSQIVYVSLAEGHALDEAVTAGRKALYRSGNANWANYVLYGDGRFRLVRP